MGMTEEEKAALHRENARKRESFFRLMVRRFRGDPDELRNLQDEWKPVADFQSLLRDPSLDGSAGGLGDEIGRARK
jgi:hypothetical protein